MRSEIYGAVNSEYIKRTRTIGNLFSDYNNDDATARRGSA